jgi:hypothetical protein
LLVAAVTAPSINAGWPEFIHQSHIDAQRNNIWPHPFRAMDARAVVAPFDIMRTKGWQRCNTLGDPLFTAEQQLTRAGELHVAWIIRSAPQQHRAINVLNGRTANDTAKRIEQVQLYVSQVLPTGELPPIYVTDVAPNLASGAQQTKIVRAMNDTIVAPRLGAFQSLNAPAAQQQVSVRDK